MVETPCDNLAQQQAEGKQLGKQEDGTQTNDCTESGWEVLRETFYFSQKETTGVWAWGHSLMGVWMQQCGYKGQPFTVSGGITEENQPESTRARSPHSSAQNSQGACQLHQENGKDHLSWLLHREVQLRSPCHSWLLPTRGLRREQKLHQGTQNWQVKYSSLWTARLLCNKCKTTKLQVMQVLMLDRGDFHTWFRADLSVPVTAK